MARQCRKAAATSPCHQLCTAWSWHPRAHPPHFSLPCLNLSILLSAAEPGTCSPCAAAVRDASARGKRPPAPPSVTGCQGRPCSRAGISGCPHLFPSISSVRYQQSVLVSCSLGSCAILCDFGSESWDFFQPFENAAGRHPSLQPSPAAGSIPSFCNTFNLS